MKKMGNFKRYFIVAVAVLCLLTANSTSATGADGLQGVESLSNLSIPENYGTIKDKYINNYSDSLIVHIQDLHCNYDAQMSIYNMLNKLVNENNFKMVTVEGSVGMLETAPFSNYPDEDIKEKVAQHFVERGKIGGPSYAHIMNESSFAFWGADDAELYEQNGAALKGSLSDKSKNSAFCDSIKSILVQFKQKAYNKQLLHFDNQARAYKQEEVSFGDFAIYLSELIGEHKIEIKDYANFKKLIEVLNLEKDIDFTLVDTQRSKCVEKLGRVLKREKLSELMDMSLHFKTADIGAAEFYSYLKEAVDNTRRVDFEDYPELEKYISYILSYNSIEHAALFKEIDQAQDIVKEKLFTREIEREIDKLSKDIEILKGLINLKLTAETLTRYRKDRSAFLVSNFINFITKNAPKYRIRYYIDPSHRNIDAKLPDLERFYTLALERDKALVNNTIDRMNQINIKQAILVAGGFHTDGITETLKKKGISYVVITPKINELNEENNPYLSVIMEERTPFEQHLYKHAPKDVIQDTYVFQQEAKYFCDIYKLLYDKKILTRE